MRIVSVFRYGNNLAIRRCPNFDGGSILRDASLILRPVKPSWRTFLLEEKADADFMAERQNVMDEQ
ncbi:AbrB family transcriptional regulator [Chimaeribacter californicus]|uniref:AbrB family transcriptional regulator n=1 Tax=Chimaeribacter californicus TaxID=2060067 RepID=A0A2N5EC63_9GAMM|nr:AbrB family transcriptional regulator [Chimaeribacter californicus]PLR39699.1 AbrB family transcriptional regulator [Chimaeribacter californicus]